MIGDHMLAVNKLTAIIVDEEKTDEARKETRVAEVWSENFGLVVRVPVELLLLLEQKVSD